MNNLYEYHLNKVFYRKMFQAIAVEAKGSRTFGSLISTSFQIDR